MSFAAAAAPFTSTVSASDPRIWTGGSAASTMPSEHAELDAGVERSHKSTVDGESRYGKQISVATRDPMHTSMLDRERPTVASATSQVLTCEQRGESPLYLAPKTEPRDVVQPSPPPLDRNAGVVSHETWAGAVRHGPFALAQNAAWKRCESRWDSMTALGPLKKRPVARGVADMAPTHQSTGRACAEAADTTAQKSVQKGLPSTPQNSPSGDGDESLSIGIDALVDEAANLADLLDELVPPAQNFPLQELEPEQETLRLKVLAADHSPGILPGRRIFGLESSDDSSSDSSSDDSPSPPPAINIQGRDALSHLNEPQPKRAMNANVNDAPMDGSNTPVHDEKRVALAATAVSVATAAVAQPAAAVAISAAAFAQPAAAFAAAALAKPATSFAQRVQEEEILAGRDALSYLDEPRSSRTVDDTPMDGSNTPVHDEELRPAVLYAVEIALNELKEAEVQAVEKQGADGPIWFNQYGSFRPAADQSRLPDLAALFAQAGVQQTEFDNLVIVARKHLPDNREPTDHELHTCIGCLLAINSTQPILGANLTPGSLDTKSLATIYKSLLPSIYKILNGMIDCQQVLNDLATVVGVFVDLTMLAESKLNFPGGSVVPKSPEELMIYLKTSQEVGAITAPQFKRLYAIFMEAYEKLLFATREQAEAIELLFLKDREATAVLMQLDSQQQQINEHVQGDGHHNGRPLSLANDDTNNVYPPFLNFIAHTLQTLHKMSSVLEATREWLIAIKASSLKYTSALESWFMGELYACPALNREELSKIDAKLMYRKINALAHPTVVHDVVAKAFHEPQQQRTLVACATRLSSSQPPRVWTETEEIAFKQFAEYATAKRELSNRNRADETQAQTHTDNIMNALPTTHPECHIPDSHLNPRPDRSATDEERSIQIKNYSRPSTPSGGPNPRPLASDATTQLNVLEAASARYSGQNQQRYRAGRSPPSNYQPIHINREIEAWGADPPELPAASMDTRTETLQFVPIPAPLGEDGLPTSSLAGQQRNGPSRLRPQTPPPTRDDSPSKFWRDDAFQEDSQAPCGSPPDTQVATDVSVPNEVETLSPPEPLITPTAPPHTPTPLDAPPAPTQLSREKTESAPRRRRLDLTSHEDVKTTADSHAWGGDPPQIHTLPKPEPNEPSSVKAVDISQYVLKELSTGSPPRYHQMATNNLDTLLSDEAGARCYHCLGEPTICPDTPVVDHSTVICPLCGIDAVVPASEVKDEAVLHAWRYLAFYSSPRVNAPKGEQTTAQPCIPEAPTTQCDPTRMTSEDEGVLDAWRHLAFHSSPRLDAPEGEQTTLRPCQPCIPEAPTTQCDDNVVQRYDKIASAYDKAIQCMHHSKGEMSCEAAVHAAVRQLSRLLQEDPPQPATLWDIETVLRAHLTPDAGEKADNKVRSHRTWTSRLEVLRPRTELLTMTAGDLELEPDVIVPLEPDAAAAHAPKTEPTPQEPYTHLSEQRPAEKDSLSSTYHGTSLPAAYLDTRPLSVAFQGDASGATVVFVSGATVPIEHGGQGLQANQDITIDASRIQAHPKLMGMINRNTPDPRTKAQLPCNPAAFSSPTRGKGSLRDLAESLENKQRSTRSQVVSKCTPFGPRGKGKHAHRSGQYGFPYSGSWGEPGYQKPKERAPPPQAPPSPTPTPCDPILNQWFTGRATLLNKHEGSISESAEADSAQLTFETHQCHGFDYSDDATAEYWVAFRKDPTNHPGRALSVVRVSLPDRRPGWDRLKATPAHRPQPPYKGRCKLPLVSIVDSLPTVQDLFNRYYGPGEFITPQNRDAYEIGECPSDPVYVTSWVKQEVDNTMFGRVQYTSFPLTLESSDFPRELTNLHKYGRVYQGGLSYPYEGQTASVRTKGGGAELFKDKYCTLLEYMLGHAPKALYTQINLRGIYFINDLKYFGKPTKTLVVPSAGVILIDLAELVHSLSVTMDLAKTLTYKVSRVLHELGHLCDYTADPEGWQKPDAMLSYLLPDHRFPSASNPTLHISCATRNRLPNNMLYAATSPEEFRAETLADVWMSEECTEGGPRRGASLAYWDARARIKIPALCRMLDGGFPAPFHLPSWGRDAIYQYQIGDHKETTPITLGLKELARGQHVAKSRQEAICINTDSDTAYAGDTEEPPLWRARAGEEPNVTVADLTVVDLKDLPEGYPLTTHSRFDELSNTPPSGDAADDADSIHDDDDGEAEDNRVNPSQFLHPRMTGASNRLARREPRPPKNGGGGKENVHMADRQPGWVTCQNTWDRDHGRGHGSQRMLVAAAMKRRAPSGTGTCSMEQRTLPPGSPPHRYRNSALPSTALNANRGESWAEREGCSKSRRRDRSPISLRSRRAVAETSFLQKLEEQYVHSHTPPQGLCEVTVFFDVSGYTQTQRHKIKLDLDEQAALLLYRIVLQIVGHVSPNMLGWRLLGGPHQVSFDTMDSGRGVGLCGGSRYSLIGRMRGGGDQPHQSDDAEPSISLNPEEPRQRGGVITRGQSHISDATHGIHQLQIGQDADESGGQEASDLVDPQSSTPALAPGTGQVSSNQRGLPTDRQENPIDVSPPYRPLTDGADGNAHVEATAQGDLEATPIPLPSRQRPEILTFTPGPDAAFQSWTAAVPAPPATPREATEGFPSEEATVVESRGPFRFTPREAAGSFRSEAPAELRRQGAQPDGPSAHDTEAEARRRQAQSLEDRIEAEVQFRTDAELQRRLVAATVAALQGVEEEPPQNTTASEATASQRATQAQEVGASHSRSVIFDSVEPASLPHRPRSERPAGTESRWQHFQHGGTDARWGDEPEMPSRQSSARSQSPPSPTARDHMPNAPTPTPSGPGANRHHSSGPSHAPTSTSSAQAAHRGATGSTFTQPNNADADAQQNTLSYWEAAESTTFTDAPSTSIMDRYFERHQVDPAVIELVKRVRRQPWQANCASPHTNCFNPNLERPPIRQDRILNSFKKLSDTRVSQKDFKFFHDTRLTAPTEHEQLHAWIKVRAEMCITLRQCVDTRCAGSEFLPAIRDELNRMLGHTQALPQLAALIVQGLQTFVTLASNCLLLACDNHFCPEYSPLTALQTVQRKSGQALVDLFANIELLMLQSKHQEQQGRDYLYTTLCNTDRQVIPDLHRYAVHAIESGDQPWAPEVALAFDRACTNARAYARTVNERDRPNVLQLQTIAFTAGVIGLDQNLSLGYRNGGRAASNVLDHEDPLHVTRQARVRGPRIRNTVAPVTTRSAAPMQRPPPQPHQPSPPPPLAPMRPPQPPPPPPPPPQQMQHLKPLDHTDRQGSFQPTEPRRGSTAPNPITTTNLWIDMMEVRRASEESDPTRRRLATMVWPSDDCTRFASEIECKPTPVFENDGKPAYFNDGRPMVTFNHKSACRHCSVWAAQPANREEWKLWPQEVRDGQHNPKVCPRTIATLLKAGNPGASFLKERWGKNKATRPEGGQRRAGQ